MSKEAASQIGSVAFLGLTLASTGMLVQAATSLMKDTETKMRTLEKKAPRKPMKIPSVSEAIFGKKKRR